jgi:HSP20 family protein
MFIRRNPSEALWNGLEWFKGEMHRLFNRSEGGLAPRQTGAYPPVNVWEDADNLYVEAELPGVQADKLEIYVTEGNRWWVGNAERRGFLRAWGLKFPVLSGPSNNHSPPSGNQLVLKGVRQPPQTEKGVWHRQERRCGAFERVLALPVAVEPDKVAALAEHGVLRVTLPKPANANLRRIQVSAG